MADDAHSSGQADGETTRAADGATQADDAPAARRISSTTSNSTSSDAASDTDPDATAGSGTDAAVSAASTSAAGSGPDGAAESGASSDERPYREMMLQSIGGWRGMVDSALPVVVFVVANVLGGLTVAIWAAVIAGLALMAVRLARKQSVQQAVSGFFGVAIAAFIAHRTGEAKGFFLLGIWGSFVYAGVFLISVLVRWPAVGVIWEYIDNGTTTWRGQRRLMRVYSWTTLVWVAMFASRGIVQRFLYDEDRTGWLAFARLAMGYPLTLIALGVTLLAVRRARALHAAATEPADPETAGAATSPGSRTGTAEDRD